MSTVADALVERLHRWNVRRIFGYPGDAIHPLMTALERRGDDFDLVPAIDQQEAAFMACGHAKATGEVGVCLVASGAASTNALTGLWDAHLDHQPVLALLGTMPLSVQGGSYREEVDLVPSLSQVAPDYAQTILTPTQMRHVVDRAMRAALAERMPTAIAIPVDVQEASADDPSHAHDTVHSGAGYHAPRVLPSEAELDRAADLLNAGSKVAILVGIGAQDAVDEVIAVADLLGAGVAKALLGKAVLPDDLPFVTGTIGLLGSKPSYAMMQACDTLLVVGSRFPYSEFLPREGAARAVQIDLDPKMLSIRYPMEVGLVGDAAGTLRALIPRLRTKTDRAFRTEIESSVASWWDTLARRAQVDADPVNPQLLFHELSPRLPDDVLLACDPGNSVHWFARHLRMRRGMRVFHSGFLSAMGSSLPYALAAKLAHPSRCAVAFLGDGAMQMRGVNSLFTLARLRSRFTDPRFVVVVLNDGKLSMDVWEKRILRGDSADGELQRIGRHSYARLAEDLGLRGIAIERPEDVVPALEDALASKVPVVVDVHVDPKVPPLPPRISMAQAMGYAASMLKGDAEAIAAVRASLADLFA